MERALADVSESAKASIPKTKRMTTKNFTVAIAGCGAGIAELHLQAIAIQLDTARIVGMCDVNATRGEPRAQQADCAFLCRPRDR